MIGRLSVVSRPTSTSKKSARWLIWNPVPRPSAPMPTRPAPQTDLPGDEERRQVLDDVRERRGPAHEVVLVGAVGGALIVGVVLVQLDRVRAGHGGGLGRRLRHDPLARLVPDHHRQRVGALGRRVLRVRVVDVEPRPVGQDDVSQPQVLIGELGGVRRLPCEVEPSRVPQRVLLLEVPPGAARPGGRGRLVGIDDLDEVTIALAPGWPGTEMPYSVVRPVPPLRVGISHSCWRESCPVRSRQCSKAAGPDASPEARGRFGSRGRAIHS